MLKLRERSMVLLTFLKTFRRCSSNVDLKSKVIPKCFWELTWDTILLLKTSDGWILLFIFGITSWACLLTSGLKLNFHWKVQFLIFLRSTFSTLGDTFTWWVTKNKDVLSANSLTLDDKLLDKSLI